MQHLSEIQCETRVWKTHRHVPLLWCQCQSLPARPPQTRLLLSLLIILISTTTTILLLLLPVLIFTWLLPLLYQWQIQGCNTITTASGVILLPQPLVLLLLLPPLLLLLLVLPNLPLFVLLLILVLLCIAPTFPTPTTVSLQHIKLQRVAQYYIQERTPLPLQYPDSDYSVTHKPTHTLTQTSTAIAWGN